MISIVIPTYKNVEQLRKNLRHNMPYIGNAEVIVVNDFPDDDLSSLTQEFPITLIQNKKNLGFSGAINAGVAQATQRFVLLLNSDVLLHDNTYTNALSHFHHQQGLFAVSFSQREKNGTIVGRNRLFWRQGLLLHEHNPHNVTGITAWAEGGSSVIQKTIFEKLGGFDTMFAPFYWEDIDLSYRAWKAGYSVLYDSEIQVEHHHESTISTHFKQEAIKQVAYRNQFLCIWKNITDKTYLRSHYTYLPKHLLNHTRKGDFAFSKGFFDALHRRAMIHVDTSQFVRSDHEILAQFS